MILVLFFTVLSITALALAILSSWPTTARIALLVLSPALLLLGFILGSSVVVETNTVGVVIRQFGKELPSGQTIARNGEQGVQAQILSPGWHFGYFAFVYDIEHHPTIEVPQDKMGFVNAKDGAPMDEGSSFAKPWASSQDMMNPEIFLKQGGQRGPQSTVLQPGTYPYNPRLHTVTFIDRLNVPAGSVAVITAANGSTTHATEALTKVNGVPLVKEGSRGIWATPLLPGSYPLNVAVLKPTLVKTIQRVYVYQQSQARSGSNKSQGNADWSVTVRSKDGFTFPIDVRIVCAVEAKDAPYLVALLGNPDQVLKDEQEEESLEILEAKVVLPVVRATFRNVAETMNALEFLTARSVVEKAATDRIRIELARSRVTCEGVFLGNIHLDLTEAGRKLMATQTDREVAINEEKLYADKRRAEEARAAFVKAQEEAEQQRNVVKASYEVQVKEQGAKARAAEAKGEADYQIITGEGRAKAYSAMVSTLGREQVAQLELLKLVAEGKIQITPQVMVNGNGSGVMDALSGTILRQSLQTTKPELTK